MINLFKKRNYAAFLITFLLILFSVSCSYATIVDGNDFGNVSNASSLDTSNSNTMEVQGAVPPGYPNVSGSGNFGIGLALGSGNFGVGDSNGQNDTDDQFTVTSGNFGVGNSNDQNGTDKQSTKIRMQDTGLPIAGLILAILMILGGFSSKYNN